MNIYANNAATSFPKPDTVAKAVFDCLTNIGSNPGRSASFKNLEGSRILFQCRDNLCDLFHFDSPENVIFTNNITSSLNTVISGCVKKGWHVITSSMEHNSVLRPLNKLAAEGYIELDIIETDETGLFTPELLKAHLKDSTKLLVLSHSSNIIGTIQPIKELGEICRENSMHFIIDGAQSAGVLDIDLSDIYFSAFCFTGHKSLFGPQGTGGFIITDEFNNVLSPYMVGGTGSASSDIIQPMFLPDKFESGTMNTPGIAGLNEGIKFILNEGISTIREHEIELNKFFIENILNIDDISFYGFKDASMRTSALSLNSKKIENAQLSFSLDSEYGILTRSGLHCAPLAHKTIGTYPQGSLRMSFGYFNTIEEVKYCLDSIKKL